MAGGPPLRSVIGVVACGVGQGAGPPSEVTNGPVIGGPSGGACGVTIAGRGGSIVNGARTPVSGLIFVARPSTKTASQAGAYAFTVGLAIAQPGTVGGGPQGGAAAPRTSVAGTFRATTRGRGSIGLAVGLAATLGASGPARTFIARGTATRRPGRHGRVAAAKHGARRVGTPATPRPLEALLVVSPIAVSRGPATAATPVARPCRLATITTGRPNASGPVRGRVTGRRGALAPPAPGLIATASVAATSLVGPPGPAGRATTRITRGARTPAAT